METWDSRHLEWFPVHGISGSLGCYCRAGGPGSLYSWGPITPRPQSKKNTWGKIKPLRSLIKPLGLTQKLEPSLGWMWELVPSMG